MITRRDRETVRQLCREHFGHHAMSEMPSAELRQVETARYVASLPVGQRVRVLANLRRNAVNRLRPSEARQQIQRLVELIEGSTAS